MAMQISKEEFEAYEAVRVSGVTNMWAVNVVSSISGLSPARIMFIMKSYSPLKKQFMPEEVSK